MRFVARPMTAGVNEYQPIIRLQRVDIAALVPGLNAVSEPVLNHQRRTRALDLVVNAHPLIIGIWHRRDPPIPRRFRYRGRAAAPFSRTVPASASGSPDRLKRGSGTSGR